MTITIKQLDASQIHLVSELDRSEHVTTNYIYNNGQIETKIVDWQVPRWSDEKVAEYIAALSPLLVDGAILFGGFDGEKLVGINRSGDHEFIRFYEFMGKNIFFHLLHITWKDDKPSTSWNTTLLYPHSRKEIEEALLKNGFDHLCAYSDLEFNPFTEESRDLVCTAVYPY